MTGPGQRDPEPQFDRPRSNDGLAFPPAGDAPDPGPLARGGNVRSSLRAAGPLPPAGQLQTVSRRPTRRKASGARQLALLITVLAVAGAGLTIAARESAGGWRSPGDTGADVLPTVTSGPPPTPLVAHALDRLDHVADASAIGGANTPVRWELRLRQLTFDGCCVGSWWSSDSKSLRFVDRPADGDDTALYVLPIWPPGQLPEVFDGGLSATEGEPRFSARPEGDFSVVADRVTGLEWPVQTGGNPTLVAPDGSTIAWYGATGGRSDIDGFTSFHVSAVDGSGERSLDGMWGGSLLRYLPDSAHVLALGRQDEGNADYSLRRIAVADGATEEIASGPWLSDVALSPGGSWVAFMISLDRDHPEANGIWVAPMGAGRGEPRKLELPGAYRWRDDDRLVYIPMLPGAPAHAVLQFDALLGRSSILLDPSDLPIRVAGNDWSISPDGNHLAFLAEADRCIWLLDLAE